jgi:hypothetical protein
MSETARQIVDRELRASEKPRLEQIAKMRAQAAQLIADAHSYEVGLTKQLRCNAADAHEFEEVKGSGMFGDRFEEKCKHCGWIHTC